MKIELVYDHKESEKNIISGKPEGKFIDIDSCGPEAAGGWRNRLIFGDNLIALKLLHRDDNIKGKVALIYLDPPFATNQSFKGGRDRTATISKSARDATVYDDFLNGAAYLEFMRQRLILMRELLAESGSIYVHIDCKVGHYLKIIMDEVFGRHRYVNDITRIKCNPKNFRRKGYGNIKDMVLFYTKSEQYTWNDPREPFSREEVERLFPKIDAGGQRYTTTPLHAPRETRNGPTGRPWQGLKPPPGRHWRCHPRQLEELDRQGLIEWSAKGNPRKKIYAGEITAKGKKRQDLWEFKDHPYPSYPTEKNLAMLRMLVETSSNPGDLVLDAFVGSGSAAAAAELTGRRWLGIDNSPVAIEVCKNRITKIPGFAPFAIQQVVS